MDTFVPEETGTAAATTRDAFASELLARLPADVRQGLDERQLAEIEKAAREVNWGHHPINVRLSIPTPFARFYFVALGGRERRSRERRIAERRHHPLHTTGNTLFFLVMASMLFLAGYNVGLWLYILFDTFG